MKGRTGRRELTCLLVPAAHDKLDHLLAIESILVTHNAERSEAPIYGIHTQVGSEMVHQVIFALWRMRKTASQVLAHTHLPKRLDVFDVQRDKQRSRRA